MPDTVTDLLAEIERRLAAWEEMDKAATKGPWVYDERGGCCAVYPHDRMDDTPGLHRDDERNIAYSNNGALFNGNYWDMDDGPRRNLRLIAASRSLVTASIPYWKFLLEGMKACECNELNSFSVLAQELNRQAAERLLAAIPDPNKEQ